MGTDLPVLLPARPRARGSEARWLAGGLPVALLLLALAVLAGEAAAAPAEPGILLRVLKWVPVMFGGFLFNLSISLLSMALGTVAGLGLGLLQISPAAPLRGFAWGATQFFRNAPWLVLLFYCILLLPFEIEVFGVRIDLPGWIKAVIGLSLPVMGNVSEILRGAVQSIPTGQWEAAESLAFNRRQTLWRIVLPQCVKRMLPPWMNLYAILTMATPLVSIVGVQEAMTMTRAALNAENDPALLLPMYLMLLSWFFIYCYPIARVTQRLERAYAVKQ